MASAQPAFVDDQRSSLAHVLADGAGDVIRPLFRTSLGVEHKSDDSPVTIADRQAEAWMRERIHQTFPTDGIIGEEFGCEREDAEWVWVLDPVDGTRSFVVGRPTFGTLIGLLFRGRPVLGVIDQPIARERWFGSAGAPTFLNGAPVRTSDRHERPRVSTTGPDYFDEAGLSAFGTVQRDSAFTVFGGDCYQYGLLACGGLELVIEAGLALHDWAALVPIVEGAGGVISDWAGRPLDRHAAGDVLAAASPAWAQWARQRLARGA